MLKPIFTLFALLIFGGELSLDKCYGEGALAAAPLKLPLTKVPALSALPTGGLLGTVEGLVDGATDLVDDVVDGTLGGGVVGDLLKGTTALVDDVVKDVASLDLIKNLLTALGLGGKPGDNATELVLVTLLKVRALECELKKVKGLVKTLLLLLNSKAY